MKTRSQSAMEYLMTYGWAILIIAVILGVLFSLGVFNPISYAPRVPAGNCHVFRPYGPGTNFNVALVGACSGFLPQYTAQFNGQGSFVQIPSTSSLHFGGSITITAWIYFKRTYLNNWPMALARGTEIGGFFKLAVVDSTSKTELAVYAANGTSYYLEGPLPALQTGKWYFIAGVLDSSTGNMTLYQDNSSASTIKANAILGTSTADLYIGRYGTSMDYWNGSIANVQLYNTNLNSNEIQYLYREGIGGSPIYLQHLVGWWPLNGDTNDYSGNGNNGNATNMAFNGSWTPGYSAP